VNLLPDTHLLLWAAGRSNRLPAAARMLLEDQINELLFNAANIGGVHYQTRTRQG
jgi:PIN domain nuclease of toxin-antitoxin system